jgi:hypothetical protein
VATLTEQEFNERVAILRRFKRGLIRQRDRFRRHLDELEKRGGSADPNADLEFHIAMEQSIVKEISVFERTIAPLERLYRVHDPEGAREIPALREALTRTREEVLRRTERSCELLERQLETMRDQVTTLRLHRPGAFRAPDNDPVAQRVNVTA